MEWKNKKILVTGATGFIGSHLVETLVNTGAQVRAFAQYNSQNNTGLLEILPESIRKEVEIVWGDVKEMESVKKASDGRAVIFHLASLVGIPYSYLHPQEVVMTNTIGTLNILIPTIITQALTKNEIHLGSVTPTRDLNYVLDTVAGFMRIAESPRSVGEVINIGAGFEISIGDLAAKICSLLGKDLPIVSDEKRLRPAKSEVNRLIADNRKAKELLGWEPQVSLDEGLKHTISWLESSLDAFQSDRYYV